MFIIAIHTYIHFFATFQLILSGNHKGCLTDKVRLTHKDITDQATLDLLAQCTGNPGKQASLE